MCWGLHSVRLSVPPAGSSSQTLETQREELRRSEEKLKSDNLQLCTKMREMIQEFDQEKQEAAER